MWVDGKGKKGKRPQILSHFLSKNLDFNLFWTSWYALPGGKTKQKPPNLNLLYLFDFLLLL